MKVRDEAIEIRRGLVGICEVCGRNGWIYILRLGRREVRICDDCVDELIKMLIEET